MDSNGNYRILQYIPLAGFTLLIFRLHHTKLLWTYRYFSLYVILQVVRLAVFACIKNGTNLYGYAFFVTEPLIWLSSALAIMEIYSIVLRDLKGIATVGRKGLVGSMVASVVISFATLLLDVQTAAVQFPILHNFYLLQRLVMVSLLLFVLFISICMVVFPIELNRNTVMYCRIFAAYFLTKAGTSIAFRSSAPKLWIHVNAVLYLTVGTCCVLWITMLTKAGESVKKRSGPGWDRDHEIRLMAQLDSINRTLIHSAKD